MELNTGSKGSLVLAVALLLPAGTHAASLTKGTPDYTQDTFVYDDEGGFIGSESFSELDNFNELDGYRNYADVQLVRTSGGDVTVVQTGGGYEINKARVIQTDSQNSDATIVQYGNGNTALIEQSDGSGNIAWLEQKGYGNSGYISQEGDGNYAVLLQASKRYAGSDISVDQNGGYNSAWIIDKSGSDYSVTQNGGAEIVIINNMNRNFSITQN